MRLFCYVLRNRWASHTRHMVVVVGLVALSCGCSTTTSAPEKARGQERDSVAAASVQEGSTREEGAGPDERVAGTPDEAAQGTVEEVKVVGKRIRRWLPIVGADWPSKNCSLSTHNIGDGDLHVIFIADLGRNGRAWRHVARLASRAGVRATLVTLPGSDGNPPCTWRGEVLSRATELVASLVHEGSPPASLVGDTFGGRIALEVATQVRRDDIHNVVLFDLVPYPWSFQSLAFKVYRRTHTPMHFAAQARVLPPSYTSATSGLSFPAGDFVDADARAEIVQAYARSDPVTVGYEFFRANGPGADLRSLIGQVDGPILAIWPTGPAGNERRDQEGVAGQYADVRNVEWHALPGHGAGAMLEAPGKVANALLSFWRNIGFN